MAINKNRQGREGEVCVDNSLRRRDEREEFDLCSHENTSPRAGAIL